jgi:CRP-like cAMP-binding protein
MIASKGGTTASGAVDSALSEAVAALGERVVMNLRRGQRVGLDGATNHIAYRIESGCLVCDVALPSGPRHVMLVLFPGDAISSDFVAPLAGVRLSAAMPSQIVRLTAVSRRSVVPESHTEIAAAAARLLARIGLYGAAMGHLSAEERLATFLSDVALHLGKPAPGGYTFDLPLSRRDMADHLALNPDSLSRLMSRLRSRGVLMMPTRTRAVARSLDALLALTPFGETLRQMHVSSVRR